MADNIMGTKWEKKGYVCVYVWVLAIPCSHNSDWPCQLFLLHCSGREVVAHHPSNNPSVFSSTIYLHLRKHLGPQILGLSGFC